MLEFLGELKWIYFSFFSKWYFWINEGEKKNLISLDENNYLMIPCAEMGETIILVFCKGDSPPKTVGTVNNNQVVYMIMN